MLAPIEQLMSEFLADSTMDKESPIYMAIQTLLDGSYSIALKVRFMSEVLNQSNERQFPKKWKERTFQVLSQMEGKK